MFRHSTLHTTTHTDNVRIHQAVCTCVDVLQGCGRERPKCGARVDQHHRHCALQRQQVRRWFSSSCEPCTQNPDVERDTLVQRPYCPLLSLQQQHHEQRQVVDRPTAFLFYCCTCTLSLLNSPTSADPAAATACVGAGLATGLVCQPRRWPAGLSAAWASAPTCSSGAWHKLHCALQRSAIAELSPTANMYAEGKQLLQWASDATCSSGVP